MKIPENNAIVKPMYQYEKILAINLRLTLPTPRANPTPAILPMTKPVIDVGNPILVMKSIVIEAEKLAMKAESLFRTVIFSPIVLATLRPHVSTPADIPPEQSKRRNGLTDKPSSDRVFVENAAMAPARGRQRLPHHERHE